MKVLTGIMVIVAALFASSALADRGRHDTDGDGGLSLAEIQAFRPDMTEERFKLLDKNGDGILTRDEHRPPRHHLKKLDTNADGSLDLAELQAGRPGMTAEKFAQLDLNNDGLLSPDEHPMRKARGQRFAALDTDGSGGVSLEEMQAGKNKRVAEQFARMDTDGNGEISLEEHQARADKRHHHRRTHRPDARTGDTRGEQE